MPFKLFSRKKRTCRSRSATSQVGDQPPAYGTTVVSDPACHIGTHDDVAMSAIQTSLAALKEGSSLAAKLPCIAPIAGLLLQALTMRDAREVKQYKEECKIVMRKLARVARIVVNVGELCERHNLSEEDLPASLRAILDTLQRELDRIERVLKKCSKTGLKGFLLRKDLLMKIKQCDGELSNVLQAFQAELGLDIRFALIVQKREITADSGTIETTPPTQKPNTAQIFWGFKGALDALWRGNLNAEEFGTSSDQSDVITPGLSLLVGYEGAHTFCLAITTSFSSRMPFKLFSRKQRIRRSRPATSDDQPPAQAPAHGTPVVSDPAWNIGTDDIAMRGIQTSLAALKEGSSLAAKLPYIAPIAGLLLQALTMRDAREVKQYKEECKVVMRKLARVARIVVNVSELCEMHNLSEEDLPASLRAILDTLQRELDRIEHVLKKCSKRGFKGFLLRKNLLAKIKQCDGELSNVLQAFQAELGLDIRFALVVQRREVTTDSGQIPATSSIPQKSNAAQIFWDIKGALDALWRGTLNGKEQIGTASLHKVSQAALWDGSAALRVPSSAARAPRSRLPLLAYNEARERGYKQEMYGILIHSTH
ncbi:hypothetical protein BJY52DRAFT_1189308 [Lactarius psammicola]|nr:hypothetical protein BJY52DRAFT_1189308 [Lactarius psammicola]